MKEVCISKNDFDKLNNKNIDGYNSESVLYFYHKYLLKVFNQTYNIERKKYILDFLDKNRIIINQDLKEILLPSFSLYVDKVYKGFGMKNIMGVSLDKYLKNPSISFEQKKNILIKLGEFLEKLDNLRKVNSLYQSFYINDLHTGNVMVTLDNNIKIVDVDSFRLDNLIGFPSLYLGTFNSDLYKLDKYQKFSSSIEANRESDLYCYIMIVLEFITGMKLHMKNRANYDYYMRKLRDRGLGKDLLESFKSIFDENSNINPCYALKKIDRQIIL